MLATQGLSEWQGVLAICRDPAFRFRPLIVHWDRDNVRMEVNAQMGVVRGCYLYMMEYRFDVQSGGFLRALLQVGVLGGAALIMATPAMAEEGTVADRATGFIIVTARQRPEDAQDVPTAMSVVDMSWLEQSYTLNTRDLTTLVPALNYSSANPRNTAFTIRGLGSSVVAVSQANDGLEPGVGYYVDGVYHARPATAAFDFTDIERIEVLRGPQGTLFGKNTTAGAINIISAAPSFTSKLNAELSGGEHRFMQGRFSATGPLARNTLAYRLSGTFTRRDGVLRVNRHGILTPVEG